MAASTKQWKPLAVATDSDCGDLKLRSVVTTPHTADSSVIKQVGVV